jgi:hypothetical protein
MDSADVRMHNLREAKRQRAEWEGVDEDSLESFYGTDGGIVVRPKES